MFPGGGDWGFRSLLTAAARVSVGGPNTNPVGALYQILALLPCPHCVRS
jgi:hypothetical protein